MARNRKRPRDAENSNGGEHELPRSRPKKRVRAAVQTAANILPETIQLPAVQDSDQLTTKKKTQWKNRERILSVAGRGVSYQGRHLLKDLRSLMPHHKNETKFDSKTRLFELNEVASIRNASKIMFLESRKKCDLYMWLAAPSEGGPSMRFLVENVHTLDELNLTGNCLKGSRPLLSFDKNFDDQPHLKVMKELFIQTFGTPMHHPRSQPFVDHVITFTWLDNRVWVRNYQLTDTQGIAKNKSNSADTSDEHLSEVGPRFTLNPIKIFAGSFCGGTLWENSHYVSPNNVRASVKAKKMFKYVDKVASQKARQESKGQTSYKTDETDEIFKS